MAYRQFSEQEEQRVRDAVNGQGDAASLSVDARKEIISTALRSGLDPNEPLGREGTAVPLSEMAKLYQGRFRGADDREVAAFAQDAIEARGGTMPKWGIDRGVSDGAVVPGAFGTHGTSFLGAVGDKLMSVEEAQAILKAEGHDLGPAGVDGKKGKFTEAAIKKFQDDHDLPQTGALDKDTVAALRAEDAINKGQAPQVAQGQGRGQPAPQHPMGMLGQQPAGAGRMEIDGVSTRELDAAMAAAGLSGKDVKEMKVRLGMETDGTSSSRVGYATRDTVQDVVQHLDKERGVTLEDGRHLTAAQAKAALGSMGQNPQASRDAALVMRSVDKQLEAEHGDVRVADGRGRTGRGRDDDGIFGTGVDDRDVAAASRGMRKLGQMTDIAGVSDIGRALGGGAKVVKGLGGLLG